MMAIEKSSSYQATTHKRSSMDDASHSEQPIHSGHFMITNVHNKYQENDEDDEEDSVKAELQETGFDFDSASKTISNSYAFGSNATLAIDDTLTKLFDCMSLAYR
jgi:hypothetical protein